MTIFLGNQGVKSMLRLRSVPESACLFLILNLEAQCSWLSSDGKISLFSSLDFNSSILDA